MNLAYKKILGKFTKVLGFGKTPPPCWEKFPNNIVFFFWERTLSKICSKLEQSIKKSSELHGQWSFICMSISFSRVFICVSFTFRLIVFFIFKREGSIWSSLGQKKKIWIWASLFTGQFCIGIRTPQKKFQIYRPINDSLLAISILGVFTM